MQYKSTLAIYIQNSTHAVAIFVHSTHIHTAQLYIISKYSENNDEISKEARTWARLNQV